MFGGVHMNGKQSWRETQPAPVNGVFPPCVSRETISVLLRRPDLGSHEIWEILIHCDLLENTVNKTWSHDLFFSVRLKLDFLFLYPSVLFLFSCHVHLLFVSSHLSLSLLCLVFPASRCPLSLSPSSSALIQIAGPWLSGECLKPAEGHDLCHLQ